MAINTCLRIHEVGRVRYDEVDLAFDSRQKVALDGLDLPGPAEACIHARKEKGLGIDVRQHDLRNPRAKGETTGARAAADVDNSGRRRDFAVDQLKKAVCVRAEENGIRT